MSDNNPSDTLLNNPTLQSIARLQHWISFGMAGLFCGSFFLYGTVSVYYPEVLAQTTSSDSSITLAMAISFGLIVSYVFGAVYYLYVMNNKIEKLKNDARIELSEKHQIRTVHAS